MEYAAVDSLATLTRIHEVIKETITPTWIVNPPADVGLPQAGTLKADHWRTLFAIHIPLALLSLWKEDSPIAAPNAKQMTSVLSTSMHWTCAANMMTKRTLTPQSWDSYRHSPPARHGFEGEFPFIYLTISSSGISHLRVYGLL